MVVRCVRAIICAYMRMLMPVPVYSITVLQFLDEGDTLAELAFLHVYLALSHCICAFEACGRERIPKNCLSALSAFPIKL